MEIAMPDRPEQLLEIAEKMARERGYHAFSFRDLATAAGIKSASVHYHFPTKDALGARLTARYTDAFLGALPDPDDPSLAPAALFAAYVGAFRAPLVDEGLMCLCGLFAAETDGLPQEVADEVRGFIARNEAWLARALRRIGLDGDALTDRASLILSALEGAMLMAHASGSVDRFDSAVRDLRRAGVLPG